MSASGTVLETANLEAGAFASLQQKINAKLRSSDRSKKVVPVPKTEKATPKATTTHGKTETAVRGKKRDRNGTILQSQTRAPNLKGSAAAIDPSDEEPTEDEFLKELRALGGTKEDLKLLEDVDSASEYEVEAKELPSIAGKKRPGNGNKDLEKGITNILKEIALAQSVSGIVDGDLAALPEDERKDEDGNVEGHATSATMEANRAVMQHPKGRGPRSLLKFNPRSDWYKEVGPNIDLDLAGDSGIPDQVLKAVRSYARTLLEAENETYRKLPGTSASQYNTFIASGTLSDKISALTLAVMESPLHNTKALESLIGLARKRSRAQAIDVLRSLKDLFAQESLLPNDRRLYHFPSQPALLASFSRLKAWRVGDKLPGRIEDKHLIMWEYESWLKEQYFEIIKLLELWCSDEIEFSKTRAISFIYELLKEKPEQESNLLRLLVNKLGDPVKKLASQTSYLLMQLLVSHPAMKKVVVSAIESDIMFKPGQSLHAKYYAAVTLNQTALSASEENVAHKLLDVYFGLFGSLLKSDTMLPKEDKERDDSSVISQKQKQTSTKVTEAGAAQQSELREKLISAILTGINRAYPFSSEDRQNFTAHLETLFRITHSANFNTGVQAMMSIQQLSLNNLASSNRFYRVLYESLLDPRLITASKQQLYLNLLHRSLKADLSVKRIKAFVKRMLQTLALHDPPFICGVFYLIRDLETAFPGIAALLDQPEELEDETEVFRDVDDTSQDISARPIRSQDGGDVVAKSAYDAHKRAPEHANAESACAWEILPFLAHFHPSVAIMAEKVLQHDNLPGKPDLTLHTVVHFLDRFAYRNAKLSISNLRGSSMMQPMAMNDKNAVLISITNSGKQDAPVNSEEFKSRTIGDVAAEDVFFHKYFSTMAKESQKQKVKKQKDDEGEDDEDAVWKAMQESAPDVEGDISEEDLSDEDLDMSDMSELESALEDDEDVDREGVDIDPDFFDNAGAEPPAAAEDVNAEEQSDFDGLSDEDLSQPKKSRKSSKDERKKRKMLPTFASAEEYAAMLENDDDEDIA